MLSILTNFGCHWGCRYCVYRENGINIPHTSYKTFDWNKLEEQLKKHRGELVSISGGGDPLYNYGIFESAMFYGMLFDYLEKYDCTLELHTSMVDEFFPYDRCERVVFHFTMPNQITMLDILSEKLKLPSIVRVVYVVQDYYTKALINEIAKNVNESNVISELSFRQMIGKNGETTYYLHDYLLDGHMVTNKWYYIEQCDYNEYFVQDHIETNYLEIK